MKNYNTRKRVVFTLDVVYIYDMQTNSKVSIGEVNHQSRLYTCFEFIEPDFALLLTHGDESSRIWHERLEHLNFRYMQKIRKQGMFEGLPDIHLIQMDIGGHPYVPTGSSCQFLVQHVLLYFFVIVGYTLPGLPEALHIFQVYTGGLPPNPIGLFCMFSCQHILLYFQGCFGALNNVFLSPTVKL
jgi:hypothetical protein